MKVIIKYKELLITFLKDVKLYDIDNRLFIRKGYENSALCYAMYGDERYMDYKFWRTLINKANEIILEEKSMHYMNFKKRILNFKNYFRPFPYRIFVIKSKNT
jgi:hypothetical protein